MQRVISSCHIECHYLIFYAKGDRTWRENISESNRLLGLWIYLSPAFVLGLRSERSALCALAGQSEFHAQKSSASLPKAAYQRRNQEMGAVRSSLTASTRTQTSALLFMQEGKESE